MTGMRITQDKTGIPLSVDDVKNRITFFETQQQSAW